MITDQIEARFVTDSKGVEYVSMYTDEDVYTWARTQIHNRFLSDFTRTPFMRMSERQLNVLHCARCRADQNTKPAEDITPQYVNIANMFANAARTLKSPGFNISFNEKTYQLKLAGSASRNAGSINVTDGGVYGNNTWYGVITPQGNFQPSRSSNADVVTFLAAVNDNPADVAKLHGQKYGHCCFCGLELTTKASVYAGYGPICAGKYMLPWGETED